MTTGSRRRHLRGGSDAVSAALRDELHQRVEKAGVQVEEARITHLAYAPEIAQAMLRRQQAEAIIAARQKIVHGAVSMVDMALKELADKHVVNLDEERKAAMVSNLLVVLCGEAEVTGREHGFALYVSRLPGNERADPPADRSRRPRPLRRWANDDLRSVNAQIEMLLRRALSDAGRMPKKAAPLPKRGRPNRPD